MDALYQLSYRGVFLMVLEVGLEPTMELNPADLQSAVIATRRLQQYANYIKLQAFLQHPL